MPKRSAEHSLTLTVDEAAALGRARVGAKSGSSGCGSR